MSFSPKEYAQRNLESISDRVAESADAVRRGPMTVRELLDHPERIAELNPNGQTLQDAVNAAEAAEDDYYAQLGAEIEQHPICSPHLILQRQGRNGS